MRQIVIRQGGIKVVYRIQNIGPNCAHSCVSK
jgi:hypothetical protein